MRSTKSCGNSVMAMLETMTPNSRSTGPLAGGAYAPSARGRLAWSVGRQLSGSFKERRWAKSKSIE